MPAQHDSKLFNLWRLMGYMKSTPLNMSKQEREALTRGRSTSNGSSGGSDMYYNSTTGNSDPHMHAGELAEMMKYECVAPVLDLYSEESSQPDPDKGKIVWYEVNDSDVEKDLNEMLGRIKIEDHAYSILFNIAGLGNEFRRILRSENGVEQFIHVQMHEVLRVYDVTTKRLIGFKWRGQDPEDSQGVKIGQDKTPIWCPWDFIHFRRLSQRACDADSEYGVSMIEHLFSLYRRIKLSVDQMVMYRLHIMPTRWVAWVDTGSQTPPEQADTLNSYRNFLRSTFALDDKNFDSRFNPPAMDSVIFFPKPTGDESKIETMKGENDVPDVPDLETLFRMFFGGARVPRSYIGFGDDDGGGLAKASLVCQDIRFARMIRVLRKPFMQGMMRLAEIHLTLKGKDASKYKIQVQMSKVSSIEEEIKAATVGKQAELALSIANICQQLAIPNREIIELVFREYLKLPRDFIDIAKLAASIQQAVGAPGADQGGMPGGGGGMPMGGGGMGGIGAELGLEPAPGDAGAPPDVEFTDQGGAMPEPAAPATVQDSRASFKVNAVRLFESSLIGKRDQLTEHLDNISEVVRSLQRMAITGKTSLMETEDQSTWRGESLPLVESGHLNESKSITSLSQHYGSASLQENRHSPNVGSPLELIQDRWDISGAVKVSSPGGKVSVDAAVHASVQLVERARRSKEVQS